MIMSYTSDEYHQMKDKNAQFTAAIAQKLTNAMYTIGNQQEEIEILRNERSHWHHMYNNTLDERPDI